MRRKRSRLFRIAQYIADRLGYKVICKPRYGVRTTRRLSAYLNECCPRDPEVDFFEIYPTINALLKEGTYDTEDKGQSKGNTGQRRGL